MVAIWRHNGAMPTLSIKDVPEPVAQALRERARRHHRSLQGELMALVCEAVAAEHDASLGNQPASPLSASAVRGGSAGRGVVPASSTAGSKSIEQIAREHAVRRARPARGGPTGGAQVRADRDSR